jgi:hypothetical protein
MHPITPAERATLSSAQYGIKIRSLVSIVCEGIQKSGEVLTELPGIPVASFPAGGRSVVAVKPTLKRILGYEPFLSCQIDGDLDSPLTNATIRMALGLPQPGDLTTGLTNTISLSPYLSKAASWFWTGGTTRPLLDPGIFIQLQAKLVSQIPRLVQPVAPSFAGRGTLVQTSGAGAAVSPAWPGGTQQYDIGLMFVITAGEAATVTVPAGFAECPGSPMTTGTAGASGAVRLQVYWCRATGSAMAKPSILNPGNHVIARILTWRNCKQTGNPWDVTPLGSVLATASPVFLAPTLNLTTVLNRYIAVVAGATDTTTDQTNNWASLTAVRGDGVMVGRTDSWRDIGNGGGFAVADGLKTNDGSTGVIQGTCTLLTASAQCRFSIALAPEPAHFVTDTDDTVPWRPFFTGRIDSINPAADGENVVELQCRDIYCDVMDGLMIPTRGQNGWLITEAEQIEDLLGEVFSHRPTSALGQYFEVVGSPGMVMPNNIFLEGNKSCLLTMRDFGLQNGWDLRPKWGTDPHGDDELVLTYYEPDRVMAGFQNIIAPTNYYEISGLGKSREEVRNYWRVVPAGDNRDPQDAQDTESQLKYGVLYATISEDATSLILTTSQAASLAAALLSDTKEPKVGAEILTRFNPWVEVGDPISLLGNDVHNEGIQKLGVSAFTHVITEDGDGTTLLRTRGNPAAANREWRQKIGGKVHFVDDGLPIGSAAEGARWYKKRAAS